MTFCFSKNIYNYIQILLLLFLVWRRTKITNWIAIVTTMHRVPLSMVYIPNSRSCFWIKIQTHFTNPKNHLLSIPQRTLININGINLHARACLANALNPHILLFQWHKIINPEILGRRWASDMVKHQALPNIEFKGGINGLKKYVTMTPSKNYTYTPNTCWLHRPSLNLIDQLCISIVISHQLVTCKYQNNSLLILHTIKNSISRPMLSPVFFFAIVITSILVRDTESSITSKIGLDIKITRRMNKFNEPKSP